jgi:hypothetical protein
MEFYDLESINDVTYKTLNNNSVKLYNFDLMTLTGYKVCLYNIDSYKFYALH